jgi:hypothetical protein
MGVLYLAGHSSEEFNLPSTGNSTTISIVLGPENTSYFAINSKGQGRYALGLSLKLWEQLRALKPSRQDIQIFGFSIQSTKPLKMRD